MKEQIIEEAISFSFRRSRSRRGQQVLLFKINPNSNFDDEFRENLLYVITMKKV